MDGSGIDDGLDLIGEELPEASDDIITLSEVRAAGDQMPGDESSRQWYHDCHWLHAQQQACHATACCCHQSLAVSIACCSSSCFFASE